MPNGRKRRDWLAARIRRIVEDLPHDEFLAGEIETKHNDGLRSYRVSVREISGILRGYGIAESLGRRKSRTVVWRRTI